MELANKAHIDMTAGRTKSALKKAVLGTKKHPKVAIFWTIAGVASNTLGQQKIALAHFQKAYKLEPNSVDHIRNLAVALEASGASDKAEELYTHACKTRPNCEQIRLLLIKKLIRDHAWERAHQASNELIELNPNSADGFHNRGISNYRLGRLQESDSDKGRAHQLAPLNIRYAFSYAISLSQNRKTREAIEKHWEILEKSPHEPNVIHNLSEMLRGDEAKKLTPFIDEALKAFSDHPYQLEFARAHIVKETEGLGSALSVYAKANALQQEADRFDEIHEVNRFDIVTRHFQNGAPEFRSVGEIDPVPVFIIGQPRSGTTLLEIMLSRSQKVQNFGELRTAALLTDKFIYSDAVFDENSAAALSREYKRLMPMREECSPVVTDKMPQNYRILGFLAASIPNAKFINMLRDPRDVALSAWIRRFHEGGMNYASSWHAMSICANNYRKYMKFWNQLFPDQIYNLQYEDLVRDPKEHSKSVADFLSIPWEESILRPELSTASVRTASIDQVQNKIGSKSVGTWRDHAKHLEEFIQGLDPVLWPEYDLLQ